MALPISLRARQGVDVVKRCDVVVACVDDDGARIAAATIATQYHRPLIDVGVGVLGPPAGSRVVNSGGHRDLWRIGADVRMIVPGYGCLMCHGGVSDEWRAVRRQHGTELPFQSSDGRVRRGSLASLNHVACGLAVSLLQDLVAERIQGSTWSHLEFEPEGRIKVEYAPVVRVPPTSCALCALSGAGDTPPS